MGTYSNVNLALSYSNFAEGTSNFCKGAFPATNDETGDPLFAKWSIAQRDVVIFRYKPQNLSCLCHKSALSLLCCTHCVMTCVQRGARVSQKHALHAEKSSVSGNIFAASGLLFECVGFALPECVCPWNMSSSTCVWLQHEHQHRELPKRNTTRHRDAADHHHNYNYKRSL